MVDGFGDLGLGKGTPSACDKHMESEFEKTATLTPAIQREFKKIGFSNQNNSGSI